MNIRSLFFDETGRVRSGWRLVIFCVGFLALVVPLNDVLFAALPQSAPITLFRLANVLIILFPALVVGWLCARFLEGLPLSSLGFSFAPGWLRNLIAGILIGTVSLAFAVFISVIFGGLRFDINPIDTSALLPALLTSFMFLAVAAASEEILFRGYPFQTLARSGLAWLAIALTSVLFARVHLRNPDAGVISTVNTCLAGIWFATAYLKTRDLWLAWGMHLMWNWVQGAFFGIEISGMTDLTSASLLREIDRGPAWLTGETYGVEGGIVTTIALIVSTVMIYFLPWLKPRPDDNE